MPRLIRVGRIAQAGAVGSLGGLFFIIAANSSDIKAYLDYKFITANKAVAADAAKLVDGNITRSKQALSQEEAELANLRKSSQTLRTNDVRRDSGRKANAPAAIINPQMEGLDRRLSEVTARRDALIATLATQESNRNAAIEKVIEDSPDAIRKRTGLSAKIEALTALGSEDPKLFWIWAMIDFLSICLECGPLWAASTKLSSALAARLSLGAYVEASDLAKEGAEKLGVRPLAISRPAEEPAAAEPPNDDALNELLAAAFRTPPPPDDEPPPPPIGGAASLKRGRGRPRKNGLDITVAGKEIGHD